MSIEFGGAADHSGPNVNEVSPDTPVVRLGSILRNAEPEYPKAPTPDSAPMICPPETRQGSVDTEPVQASLQPAIESALDSVPSSGNPKILDRPTLEAKLQELQQSPPEKALFVPSDKAINGVLYHGNTAMLQRAMSDIATDRFKDEQARVDAHSAALLAQLASLRDTDTYVVKSNEVSSPYDMKFLTPEELYEAILAVRDIGGPGALGQDPESSVSHEVQHAKALTDLGIPPKDIIYALRPVVTGRSEEHTFISFVAACIPRRFEDTKLAYATVAAAPETPSEDDVNLMYNMGYIGEKDIIKRALSHNIRNERQMPMPNMVYDPAFRLYKPR